MKNYNFTFDENEMNDIKLICERNGIDQSVVMRNMIKFANDCAETERDFVEMFGGPKQSMTRDVEGKFESKVDPNVYDMHSNLRSKIEKRQFAQTYYKVVTKTNVYLYRVERIEIKGNNVITTFLKKGRTNKIEEDIEKAADKIVDALGVPFDPVSVFRFFRCLDNSIYVNEICESARMNRTKQIVNLSYANPLWAMIQDDKFFDNLNIQADIREKVIVNLKRLAYENLILIVWLKNNTLKEESVERAIRNAERYKKEYATYYAPKKVVEKKVEKKVEREEKTDLWSRTKRVFK